MSSNRPTPLTPAVFHILLALANGERHGYGIMKQVEFDSAAAVKMGAGTLYGSLKRMVDAGLVTEGGTRIDPNLDDARRIYYRITDRGAQALESEFERLSHLVKRAREIKTLATETSL